MKTVANGGTSNEAFDNTEEIDLSDDPTEKNGHVNPAFDGPVAEDKKSSDNKVGVLGVEQPLDEEVAQCGPCGIHVKFLSCCLSAKWVLVFLSWAALIQGMVINGFVNVVITTIERRFALQSAQTGFIAGSYDIGSMLCVIPITYYGGRLGSSKPRYIAWGMIFMGSGSLLFSLPHFLTDRYVSAPSNLTSAPGDEAGLCLGAPADVAACVVSRLSNYRYFFIFGQILHGFGAAPLITLGTTLLNESVKKKTAPLYIGIFQMFFVVGPAVGYIVGGTFLRFYTDFELITSLSEIAHLTAATWVGAWWLGFIIAWLMSWACGFCIAFFPAVLPGSSVHNTISHEDSSKFGTLKDLPKALGILLTNPTYMMLNIGGAIDGFVIAGLSAFLPKVLESQYLLSSAFAATLIGIIVVPAGGIGTFLGGYFAKRFKLSRSGVIKMYIYCQAITIPMTLGNLAFCPNVGFTGVTLPYTGVEELAPDIASACNRDCNCSVSEYDPICGVDNRLYFSPCFAGCHETFKANGTVKYNDCSCVPDTQTATREACDPGCKLLPVMLVCLFLSIFFTFMASMPSVVATLRAVEPVHQSLAIGVQTIFGRLIGSIPGPVAFGVAIDATCLLWQKKECDEGQGSCKFYNNEQMAIKLTIMAVIMKILAVSSYGLALYFSKRSKIPDDVEEPVNETNDETGDSDDLKKK